MISYSLHTAEEVMKQRTLEPSTTADDKDTSCVPGALSSKPNADPEQEGAAGKPEDPTAVGNQSASPGVEIGGGTAQDLLANTQVSHPSTITVHLHNRL